MNFPLGGTLDNFAPAMDYFKEMKANQPIVVNQTSYARVLSGEIPILVDARLQRQSRPLQGQGERRVRDAGGRLAAGALRRVMTKNAPHPETPKKVADYLLSTKARRVGECLPAAGSPMRCRRTPPTGMFPPAEYARVKDDRLQQVGRRPEVVRRSLSGGSPLSDGRRRGLPSTRTHRRICDPMTASPVRAAESRRLLLLVTPAIVVFLAFWLLPIGQLIVLGGSGEHGLAVPISTCCQFRDT